MSIISVPSLVNLEYPVTHPKSQESEFWNASEMQNRISKELYSNHNHYLGSSKAFSILWEVTLVISDITSVIGVYRIER